MGNGTVHSLAPHVADFRKLDPCIGDMRILICNTFLYRRGGTETYTLALADLLRSKGHDVAFFAMRHPANQPCEQSGYFVDYIDYPSMHTRATPASAARVLSRAVYHRDSRRRIRRLIEDWSPDVVHLQNLHAHLTPSIIDGCRDAQVPVVWTLHDFKLLCPEHSFYRNGRPCEECASGRFYRCALHRCKRGSVAASAVATLEAYVHAALGVCRNVDRFIAPSRFLKAKFESYGWTEPRIEFIRHFLPAQGEPVSDGRGYGIFTGMLRPIKGVATLLDGLALAGDPNFLIVGDGPMRQELERRAAALELRNVRFAGHLDGPKLSDAGAGAAYAVVPSQCYENCPYAVMEMMAAGKPVIGSAHGGMAELIDSGRTGLLFEPGNGAALAAAIRRLAGDPAERARLGAASRRFAEKEFDAGTHYDRLISVYRDVVGAAATAVTARSA